MANRYPVTIAFPEGREVYATDPMALLLALAVEFPDALTGVWLDRLLAFAEQQPLAAESRAEIRRCETQKQRPLTAIHQANLSPDQTAQLAMTFAAV